MMKMRYVGLLALTGLAFMTARTMAAVDAASTSVKPYGATFQLASLEDRNPARTAALDAFVTSDKAIISEIETFDALNASLSTLKAGDWVGFNLVGVAMRSVIPAAWNNNYTNFHASQNTEIMGQLSGLDHPAERNAAAWNHVLQNTDHTLTETNLPALLEILHARGVNTFLFTTNIPGIPFGGVSEKGLVVEQLKSLRIHVNPPIALRDQKFTDKGSFAGSYPEIYDGVMYQSGSYPVTPMYIGEILEAILDSASATVPTALTLVDYNKPASKRNTYFLDQITDSHGIETQSIWFKDPKMFCESGMDPIAYEGYWQAAVDYAKSLPAELLTTIRHE